MPDSAKQTAAFMAEQAAAATNGPRFLWARTILKSPTWHAEVSRVLRKEHPNAPVVVVDPYTFFGLIQLDYGRKASTAGRMLPEGSNKARASH